MTTDTIRTDPMPQDIEPADEQNWPWIPDAPSLPLSEALGQDSDSSDDEDHPVYARSRTAAHELQTFDGNVLSRGEQVGRTVADIGSPIGGIGMLGIGLWQGWGLLETIRDTGSLLAYTAAGTGAGMVLITIGLILGVIPGSAIRGRAEGRRLAREEAHVRVGENAALSQLSDLVVENADGDDDVLWDMWEDLTELADEAAAARQDAGPAQLGVYNDNLDAMATRIKRFIEQRQAPEVDAQKVLVELESHSDTEMATLLAERLAHKNQMWDRIAPVAETAETDNKES